MRIAFVRSANHEQERIHVVFEDGTVDTLDRDKDGLYTSVPPLPSSGAHVRRYIDLLDWYVEPNPRLTLRGLTEVMDKRFGVNGWRVSQYGLPHPIEPKSKQDAGVSGIDNPHQLVESDKKEPDTVPFLDPKLYAPQDALITPRLRFGGVVPENRVVMSFSSEERKASWYVVAAQPTRVDVIFLVLLIREIDGTKKAAMCLATLSGLSAIPDVARGVHSYDRTITLGEVIKDHGIDEQNIYGGLITLTEE